MNDPRFVRPLWSRRDVFKGSAAVIAGVYGLSWRFAHADEIPDQFDGSKFQLAAPEPNPKSGGVLRVGLVHYNTAEEVDRLLIALREMSRTEK